MLARAANAGAATTRAPALQAQLQLQQVVINATPLQSFALPLNEVPSAVQTASAPDIERQQSLDVVDYLNDNFSGINVSGSAGNPFQIDVYYHGFTASPLLGTPEGLSVYVDGVRVNESFGDTVNWDLIPQSAIETVSLFSGSNPVFGLNTLGGALAIKTKSGRDAPGTQIEAYGGSYDRRSLQGETGGTFGPFDYFLDADYFDEAGWRNIDDSKLLRSFAKFGWQTATTRLALSYTHADNFMRGDGATPLSMLAYNREQIYTPDYTRNIMNFVNLTGRRKLGHRLLLSGNAFYRYLDTSAENGNINESYLESNYAGPPTDCSDAGANPATLAYCEPGQNANSATTERSEGFGLQLSSADDLLGLKNRAVLGEDYTNAQDSFSQAFLYGDLSYPLHQLRYVQSPYNDQDFIGVSGSNPIFGAYFTDTLSPSNLIHVTAAVRYNSSHQTLDGYSIDDNPADYGKGFLGSTPVTGSHTFVHINPAIGVTFTPTQSATYYATFNEASRAPTVIELGCSSATQPCGLPDDFASDPDLKQVVSRNLEIGLRGNLPDQSLNWSADIFHTINANDIQFVATSLDSGYFDNVGDTRREGLDVAFGGKEGGLDWKIAYSYVSATFQSTFVVNAPSNSTADANGNIAVRPGDRIPLIPLHVARLILHYDVNRRLELGGSLIFASSSYLHGDENNANMAGTTDIASGTYIAPDGTGTTPSYVTLNLNATYQVDRNVAIFARVSNALNRDYYTAGFLSQASYTPNGRLIANPGDWSNENDVTPSAPREVWGGVRAWF